MIQFLAAAVPEGRMFGLDEQTLWQFAMQFINTAILAAILYFLLYKPVRKFMQARTERIQAQIDRAEEERQAADGLKARYEESLAEIEQERAEILNAAHQAAAQTSKEMLEESKDRALAIKQQAELDILREQEQAKDAFRLHVIELSSAMAAKIIAHAIDKETQDRLFDEALSELEDAKWPK